MENDVYKTLEITGTSANSIEDAVSIAIGKASKTVRKLKWFEVSEIRGLIGEDNVLQWQVTVKLGFNLD